MLKMYLSGNLLYIVAVLSCIATTSSQRFRSPPFRNDQSFSSTRAFGNQRVAQQNTCDWSDDSYSIPLPRPSANERGQTAPELAFISDFSWKFFKETRLTSEAGNLILSPISAQILLAMLERASVQPTKQELLNIIETSQPQLIGKVLNDMRATRGANKLDVGTAIFTTQDLVLNQNFSQAAKTSQVQTKRLNFQNGNDALNAINGWASTETRGQINSILAPNYDFSQLRMLLANVVYFRGMWDVPFKNTTIGQFSVSQQTSKPATFMNTRQLWKAGEHRRSNLQYRWVQLPYEYEEFSLIVILPEVRFTLEETIAALTASDFAELLNSVESAKKRNVILSLPKFQIKSRVTLLPALQNMGLRQPFESNSGINCLTENEPVTIGDVVQDATLSVDEKGTVASAATTLHVLTLSSFHEVYQDFVFTVDQPFLAVILHKRQNLPIFIARVYDP